MARVRVVGDSAAELPAEVVERLGITVLPLSINFGDEVFRDGVDITPDQFYRKLEHSSVLPMSSPPSLRTFESVYNELNKTTDQILSIHVSSRLSQTVNVAYNAVEAFVGRCRITVIDSFSVSLGLGILVRTAAEAAAKGLSLEEIVRLVRGMIPHIYIVFFVETLEYLERGGRISKSQALLGSMLNIKPIISIEDGEIIPLEKVRTRARAFDKLFEFLAEFSRIEQVAILQGASQEDAQALIERLEMVLPTMEFPVLSYGPVLATHIGPKAMGVIVYEGVS